MQCRSQPWEGEGEEEEEKEEGGRKPDREATLPCGCALPHFADAAFESLGSVPEGTHATVPVAVVRGRFRLSFWPGQKTTGARAKLVAHNYIISYLTIYIFFKV